MDILDSLKSGFSSVTDFTYYHYILIVLLLLVYIVAKYLYVLYKRREVRMMAHNRRQQRDLRKF